MSQSGFCQTTYPRIVAYEKDTVVLFTPFQVRQINSIVIERDILKEEISLLDSLSITQNMLILNKDSQIEKYQSIITSYEASTQNLEAIIDERNRELKEYSRRSLRNSLLIGGGSLIVGLVVGFLIVK